MREVGSCESRIGRSRGQAKQGRLALRSWRNSCSNRDVTTPLGHRPTMPITRSRFIENAEFDRPSDDLIAAPIDAELVTQ